jgi:hypothetical protein
MRVLVSIVLTALAMPAAALAGPALVVRQVPVADGRALSSVDAPRFDAVGLHWQGSGRVWFKTRSVDGRWSGWLQAMPEGEDLPDNSSLEARATRGWRVGNPYWSGSSNGIAYRMKGRVRRLRAYFVQSPPDSVPGRRLSIAGSPLITPRRAWQADESITKTPRYATAVRFAVVHHTAGSNSYGPAESAAIVRAIQLYHVRGNGWNDIGYNFLVDKYGQVFEGRRGGVERSVIGAHAEGFNTGSVGVALLGNYNSASPVAAGRTALEQLLAWRLDVAHLDPLSSVTWLSGGNARFPVGSPVLLRAVSGHRDTGFTDCPGSRLYTQLGTLARNASSAGAPKLYDPVRRGGLGGEIRFSGRLSNPLAWSVSVADENGTQVAAGVGSGSEIDWTWDATGVTTGRFTWTMTAGPTVRAARGQIGEAAAQLTISSARAEPRTITPNGDSRADTTTVSYVLSRPATVTATLRDLGGTQIATLFTGARPTGRNSFRFSAAGVPDGAFEIVLSARAANREVRASVPVIVDRTLAAFRASPQFFSPNGDGRLDRVHFTFVITSRVDATVRIYRGRKPVATAFAGSLEPGSRDVPWDGRVSGRPLADGRYRAGISVVGPLGTRVQEARFTIDTGRPILRLISTRELRFWVSEPVQLSVYVNGAATPVVQDAPRGYVRVPFSSGVRRVRAVAWDRALNRSGVIRSP